MNEQNLFWRSIRGMLYIFGSGLIIFFQLLPGSALSNSYMFQNGLFVWTVAFAHRRPGSTNYFVVCFVAIFYAITIDEGIALGSMMLLCLLALVKHFRYFNVNQIFAIEWIVSTLLYVGLLILKNLILAIFFTFHFGFSEIFWLSMSFLICYPLFNILIIILVRSRKEMSTE